MTISKDLFLAILSMDSYNQGYGRGIVHGKTQIGSATLLDREGLGIDNTDYQAWQDAGFYAVAYDVGAGVEDLASGTTVISYRGTDQFSDDEDYGGSDVTNGWWFSTGSTAGTEVIPNQTTVTLLTPQAVSHSGTHQTPRLPTLYAA